MKLPVVIGGVVLVAAAAAVGAPYWVGMQTQKQYDKVIQDAANNYGFDLKDAVYHRGWLSSSARVKLRIPAEKPGNKPYVITAVTEIHHGPMVFGVPGSPVFAASVAVTTFEYPKEWSAPLHYYFKNRPPLSMTTTVAFDGASKTHVFSPTYNGPSQDGSLTVSWKGINGDSSSVVTPKGKQVTSLVKAPGLVIKGKGGTLEVNAIDLTGKGQRSQSGLMLGNAKVSVAKVGLDVSSPKSGNVHFVVNGLSFYDNVTPKGHMLNIKTGAKLKSVQVSDQTYGPGQYDMELRNISEHVATEYFKSIRDVRAMQMQGAHDPHAMAALGNKFLGLAGEFLKNSPQFEISHASIGTKEGKVAGSLLMTFDGNGKFDVRNLPLLVPRVHGEAQLQVPEMLFKTVLAGVARNQLATSFKAKGQDMPDETALTTSAMSMMEQEIQAMKDKGFIVNQDGQYSAKVVFDRGQLTVNGRPVGGAQGL